MRQFTRDKRLASILAPCDATHIRLTAVNNHLLTALSARVSRLPRTTPGPFRRGRAPGPAGDPTRRPALCRLCSPARGLARQWLLLPYRFGGRAVCLIAGTLAHCATEACIIQSWRLARSAASLPAAHRRGNRRRSASAGRPGVFIAPPTRSHPWTESYHY